MLLTCGPCNCTTEYKKGICGGRALSQIPDLGQVARSQMKRIDLRKNMLKNIDISQLIKYTYSGIIIDMRQQLNGCVFINGTVPDTIIILTDATCVSTLNHPTIAVTEQSINSTFAVAGQSITEKDDDDDTELSTKLPYIMPFITMETCSRMCNDQVRAAMQDPTTTPAVTQVTSVAELAVEAATTKATAAATTASATTATTAAPATVTAAVTITEAITAAELITGHLLIDSVETTDFPMLPRGGIVHEKREAESETAEDDVGLVPTTHSANVIPNLTQECHNTTQVRVFVMILTFETFVLGVFLFIGLLYWYKQLEKRRRCRINNSQNVELSYRSDFSNFIRNVNEDEDENENPNYPMITFSPPPPTVLPTLHVDY